jgi:release factor glutamine methyltransferase
MTIRQALKTYFNFEPDLLLAHVLNKSQEFLLLQPEHKLSAAQTSKLKALVKRRQRGEPIAYILGYKYFCGLKFLVNRSVLIPRPESEWLVEQGLNYLGRTPGAKRVLDVGTGSGCLIVSLAATRTSSSKARSTTRSSIKWVASDISKAALAVARRNAKAHQAPVKFIQSNLFDKVPGKFDLILANLPYVPAKDYKKLYAGLRLEPKLALTDGTNHSVLIGKFLQQVAAHLNNKGLVLMEIDPTSEPAMRQVVKQFRLPLQLSFSRDLHRLVRYATIKKLPPK